MRLSALWLEGLLTLDLVQISVLKDHIGNLCKLGTDIHRSLPPSLLCSPLELEHADGERQTEQTLVTNL